MAFRARRQQRFRSARFDRASGRCKFKVKRLRLDNQVGSALQGLETLSPDALF
jgi:hypothetical protein